MTLKLPLKLCNKKASRRFMKPLKNLTAWGKLVGIPAHVGIGGNEKGASVCQRGQTYFNDDTNYHITLFDAIPFVKLKVGMP